MNNKRTKWINKTFRLLDQEIDFHLNDKMEQVMVKASQFVIERSKLMIKNDADFVCVTTDLSYSKKCDDEECLVDPPPEEIFIWFEKLFTVDLASKPLNQKALEAMKKKGISPSKQPCDLHVKVVIVNSANAVHIAIQRLDHSQGENLLPETAVMSVALTMPNYTVYTYQSNQAFKDRDVYMTMVFQELKKLYPDFFREETD